MASALSLTNITKSKKYFPALTGVRAIAAFAVFFYHVIHEKLQNGSIILDNQSDIKKLFYLFVHQGQIGVTIFFVLSGFLIATRYAYDIEISSSWFCRYLQNRFARIYPMYFLLTVLTFIVMLLRSPHEWYEWSNTSNVLYKITVISLNITLLRSYLPSFIFLGIPTAWTLTIEETFYFCAPILIICLKNNFYRIYLYSFILLIAGALLVGICSQLPLRDAQLFDIGFMMNSTFFGRSNEFIVGMFLGICLSKYPTEIILPKRAALLGILGILCGLLTLVIAEQIGGSESGPPLFIFIIINNFVMPFPIVLLFWGLTKERTFLRRILSSKIFDLLGKSSYIFYLIHLGVVDSFFMSHFTDNCIIRFIVYTLISILLYKWVEYPLQKLFRVQTQSKGVLIFPET